MGDGEQMGEPIAGAPAADGGSAPATADELKWFLAEIEAICNDSDGAWWSRRQTYDDVRFCQWDGQDEKGRKTRAAKSGKEPFPFENAIDSRVRFADGIINEKVAVLLSAALRAHMGVGGMEGTDEPLAAKIRTLLKWLISSGMGNVHWFRELVKLAQSRNADNPAVGALGVWWKQDMHVGRREVSAQDVVDYLIQQAGTPEEMQTSGLAASVYDLVLNPVRRDDAVDYLVGLIPGLTKARALKMWKVWQEGGIAEVPVATMGPGHVEVTALRFFRDLFVPGNTTTLQRARVVFHRVMLAEWEVRREAAQNGWDEDWVDELLKKQGSDFLYAGKSGFPETVRVRDSSGTIQTVQGTPLEDYRGLFEVVTAYWKACNEDGVPGVYFLTFSPQVKNGTATDKTLFDYRHGQYPFVEDPREVLGDRLLDSRSISELAITDQEFLKAHNDAVGDNALVSALPPVTVPWNRPDEPVPIRPLAQLRQRKQGDYGWMNPPAYPEAALTQQDRIERRACRYHGLPHADVPEAVVQVLQQMETNGFLACLSETYKMMVQLAIQYLPPEKMARIVGTEDGLGIPPTDDEIQSCYDLELTFDVRTLDSAFISKLVEMLGKWVVPMDSRQVVQRDRLIQYVMASLSPSLAEQVVLPASAADAGEEADEEVAFTKIAAGIEPPIQKDGQNWGLRRQVLLGIGEKNPEAFAALPPKSREILEARIKHFDFMLQQEENAIIGQVGAAPVLG